MNDTSALGINTTNRHVQTSKRRANSDLLNNTSKRIRFNAQTEIESEEAGCQAFRPASATSLRNLFNSNDSGVTFGNDEQRNRLQSGSFCLGQPSETTSKTPSIHPMPIPDENNLNDTGGLKTIVALGQNKSSLDRMAVEETFSSPVFNEPTDAQPLSYKEHERTYNTDVILSIRPDGQAFKKTDIFDDDLMMQIGSKFCRQTTMHELQEEWSGEYALHHHARKDFKLKRRNILRGRKLGSGHPKSDF